MEGNRGEWRGMAGNGGVGGYRGRNWDIKDTYHLNAFMGQSLVSPLPLLRDGALPPDYEHDLGTWRPV